MDELLEVIKRRISDGTLAPSSVARNFTIALGQNGPPPENGQVWFLAGEPYLVTDVHGDGPMRSGNLRHLVGRPRGGSRGSVDPKN